MKSKNNTTVTQNGTRQEPGRFSTYIDLEAHGRQLLKEAGRGAQQIANFVSAINGWRKVHSLSKDALVGEEFGKNFDQFFFRYQDLIREAVSQRTFKDRSEQLLLWHKAYQSLLQHDSLPKGFSDALVVAFAHSGLTKAELCRQAGLRVATFNRWLSNEHLPEPASESLVCSVEKVLGMKDGTLTRRLPLRRRSRYTRGQNQGKERQVTRYGKRQLRNRETLKTYALPATERLKEQWLRLVYMKTDSARPGATVRNTWRVKPLDRTGSRLHWSMFMEGQVCVTSTVQYKQVSSYLGFLALPEVKGKGGFGLPAEGLDTLAWLVRSDYLRAFVAWQKRRADGVLHNGLFTFLDLARSHLRPQTGFLWLNPDLAQTLPGNKYDLADELALEKAWRSDCESAFNDLLKFTQVLKVNGKPRRSRDPRECIQSILSDPFPLKQLRKIVKAISHDQPPIAHQRDYAVWIRDVLLLEMISNHPLRASHFSIMTFRGPDANLYRSHDGGWRLRFIPNDFKNEKGAADELYDVSIHHSVGVWINRYLSESRPSLIGSEACDYLFLPSALGNRGARSGDAIDHEPTGMWSADNLSKRVKYVTERYSSDGMGFGVQAVRHILATDHLKRNPRDYSKVALMLNDKLETVIREYVHLEASDGTRTIRESIDLADQELDDKPEE